jgi:hypothetical protein
VLPGHLPEGDRLTEQQVGGAVHRTGLRAVLLLPVEEELPQGGVLLDVCDHALPACAAALKYDRSVRRRGTARFVLALMASYVFYERSFSRSLELGHAALGGWGLVAAVVLLGFGMALVFTAIYDGPAALGRLLRRRDDTARSPAG